MLISSFKFIKNISFLTSCPDFQVETAGMSTSTKGIATLPPIFGSRESRGHRDGDVRDCIRARVDFISGRRCGGSLVAHPVILVKSIISLDSMSV